MFTTEVIRVTIAGMTRQLPNKVIITHEIETISFATNTTKNNSTYWLLSNDMGILAGINHIIIYITRLEILFILVCNILLSAYRGGWKCGYIMCTVLR